MNLSFILRKRFPVFIVPWVLWFAHAISQTSDDIASVRQLLNQIEAQTPPKWRYAGAYIEGGGYIRFKEFFRLQETMKADWRVIVDEQWDKRWSLSQQALLLVAARALPRDEYVRFLNRIADLIRNKAIRERELLKWGLSPREKHLRYFVAKDYQRQDVRSLLIKCREIFRDDPGFVSYVDSTLSGQSARELNVYLIDVDDILLWVSGFLGFLFVVVIVWKGRRKHRGER